MMKQLLNYFCIFALCLSFSANAESEGESGEINAHIAAIDSHKKSFNNFEFRSFLSGDEQNAMQTSLIVAKRARVAVDNLIDIKSISDISIAQLANEMIEVESVIEGGITAKTSLLGRFHSAKSDGTITGDIGKYISNLSALKESIEIEIANNSFQVTRVIIFYNQYEENENESKSVDLNQINLADLASIYNYYKSSKGLNSVEEIAEELSRSSKGTESIMVMNNN